VLRAPRVPTRVPLLAARLQLVLVLKVTMQEARAQIRSVARHFAPHLSTTTAQLANLVRLTALQLEVKPLLALAMPAMMLAQRRARN